MEFNNKEELIYTALTDTLNGQVADLKIHGINCDSPRTSCQYDNLGNVELLIYKDEIGEQKYKQKYRYVYY